MSEPKHEPLVNKGEVIDWFEVWHALASRGPVPLYVERWAMRKECNMEFFKGACARLTGQLPDGSNLCVVDYIVNAIRNTVAQERRP